MGDKTEHLPPGPVVHLGKVLDVIELETLVIVEDLHDPGEALPDVPFNQLFVQAPMQQTPKVEKKSPQQVGKVKSGICSSG